MTDDDERMDIENGGQHGHKSDDSFYDSDQDEEMVEAANRLLYDPSSPFRPVLTNENSQHTQANMDKTVSGKALNTPDSALASQRCTNSMSLSSLSSSQIQSSPKSSLPTASTPSFIKASFYYSQAKQRREGERDDPPKMHSGSEGLPEEAEEPGKEQEKSATTSHP